MCPVQSVTYVSGRSGFISHYEMCFFRGSACAENAFQLLNFFEIILRKDLSRFNLLRPKATAGDSTISKNRAGEF